MTALRKLREQIAKVWQPLGEMTVSQLVENNFFLSESTEGDPGRYDLENNPYWRKVLHCCDDPEVRRISILKSTQVGGTLLSMAIMLALAIIYPAPGMWVLPTRDDFKTARNRLYNNGLASNAIFRNLVPAKSKWSMEVVELGAMNLNAAWAGSAQRLRGKPCRFVWLGECDIMKYKGDAGDPHKSAEERTKQFFDSLIGKESTPVGDESKIAKDYERSNRQRWCCKCPHCGRRQVPSFFLQRTGKYAGKGGVAGYRSESGDLLEPAEAKQKVYYVCLNGCRIDQNLKNVFMKSGIWLPRGQYVMDVPVYGPFQEGENPQDWYVENGLYDPIHGKWLGKALPSGPWPQRGDTTTLPIVLGEPESTAEHSGFHVWTIMQSKISFGEIAEAYITNHDDNTLRDFFQNWLGWRYRVGQRVPKWTDLATKYARGYNAGTVPNKVWFLTGAADVQEHLVYWSVLGWAPGRTPFLIDWGEIFQTETEDGVLLASDLVQLVPAMLNRTWAVDGVNPRGREHLPVRMSGIDSNYRVGEVHDFVRSWQPERKPEKKSVRCIRGDTLPGGQRWRVSVIEKNSRDGTPYEGGLRQYQLQRTHYQDSLSQKLLSDPDQLGAPSFPRDILPSGKRLLRQLANVKKDQKGNYVMIDGTVGKDHRDIFGYHEAIADMVVGKLGWTEKAWREAEMEFQRQRKRKEGAL